MFNSEDYKTCKNILDYLKLKGQLVLKTSMEKDLGYSLESIGEIVNYLIDEKLILVTESEPCTCCLTKHGLDVLDNKGIFNYSISKYHKISLNALKVKELEGRLNSYDEQVEFWKSSTKRNKRQVVFFYLMVLLNIILIIDRIINK